MERWKFATRFAMSMVALLAVVLCGCSGGAMTAYRLERDASSLGSCAGEGQLLAQAAARGRAPASYVAAHASEVGADCGDLASVVASTSPEAGTRIGRARIVVLARQAASMFEALEKAPNDQAQAARLAQRFARISDVASNIEASA
jgi:hypothetical protein